jgi:MYXO-CTERM domain-containing protein
MSTLRLARGLAVVLGTLLGGGAVANAASVQVSTGILRVKLSQPGQPGPGQLGGGKLDPGLPGLSGGAGVMMASLAPMGGDRILVCWMDSDVQRIEAAWQGKCAVVALHADAAPSVVVPPTQITDYNGDRPFNHPSMAATADGKYALVSFASTKDSLANTDQLVMVLDANGAKVADPINIDGDGALDGVLNKDRGGNHGGGSIVRVGNDFVAAFQHNGIESYVVGLTLAGTTVTQTWKTEIFRPTNIGRPECTATGPTRALCCTAVGNNRPPEIGVGCAVLETTTGQLQKTAIVAPSDLEQRVFMNQATVAYLGNNTCAVGAVMSDGGGKTRGRKGGSTSMVYSIACDTLAVLDRTDPIAKPVAPFQRHAQITSSVFGADGVGHVAAIGCSSTGSGNAGLQMVSFDAAGKIAFDKQAGLLPVAPLCDTTYLANLGLRNPMVQGRDFIRHVGGVKNPGFGDPKGWMPEVSHFTVAAIPAVDPQDAKSPAAKNSLYLSFIPVGYKKGVTVTVGGTKPVDQIPTGPSPGTSDPSDTPPNAGGPNGSGGASGDGPGGHGGSGDSGNASGCTMSGGRDAAPSGLLIAIGLAGAWATRRRASTGKERQS